MKKKGFEELTLVPIAHIRSDFKEKFGVPRQSGRVKELTAAVVFEKEYAGPAALRGIEGDSHLWLLWGFSLEDPDAPWSPTVRPPRLGGNKRVGVFATRSPNRPNPVGLSAVEFHGITEVDGRPALSVGGADLVNGTPVYDIKPYLPHADCIPGARGGFSDGCADHALEVCVDGALLEIIPEKKRAGLLGILREDPRPGYRKDERSYGLSYAGYEVSFYVEDDRKLTVTGICKPRTAKDG